MSQKIIITKAGIDAGTATNANDLIFSSDYNTLKYATSGTFAMNNVSSATRGTVAHNLGYVPFFITYVNQISASGNGTARFGLVEHYISSGTGAVACRSYIDGTNIYFDYIAFTGTPYTILWYYKIFKNNLGL